VMDDRVGHCCLLRFACFGAFKFDRAPGGPNIPKF
jgi:hypothetical protein